ncbi:MAG: chemotaxis protein CheA [Clostridiales bacterium]|jgi:two-component system chemotaxis sensor kinase CheA|nr:chemotaxis protein CheA [Clostridiales bacterium]
MIKLADFDRESMLDMFTFEMSQLLEQLEQQVLQNESGYTMDKINEIFRIMHTIKGSAAMMMFNNVANAAHAIEDLFYYLREENPGHADYSKITDLVLASLDFIKAEIQKIEAGLPSDGDYTESSQEIKEYLVEMKAISKAKNAAAPPVTEPEKTAVSASPAVGKIPEGSGRYIYAAKLTFEDGCEMENVRAYGVVHSLGNMGFSVTHVPEDLIDEQSIELIRENGLQLMIKTDKSADEVNDILSETLFMKDLHVQQIEDTPAAPPEQPAQASVTPAAQAPLQPAPESAPVAEAAPQAAKKPAGQHVISVNVSKLDQLLKLMGELVISEAMVTQNPELDSLELESFHKEARQLRKIIKDIQDTVMSMRMVPLSTTFFKMHRIVRDMCKQLGKEIELDIVGEETEVDKNIIEHISDPLMHIIRNSVDHGIEHPNERNAAGKSEQGTILLEAKNSGSDVLIIVKDDGAGLNRDKILEKAKKNGLLRKAESDYTDKEIHQFIFLPGFSTNEAVTSFSGRGVGMDVVSKNLEMVGGNVIVESTPGEGSVFTLKIPLTLAIIEGMMVKMGGAKYTLPIVSIKESFKPDQKDVFSDPNGNEMITVRGECYNIVRLYEFFGVESEITNFEDGIMMMIEDGDKTICLFVDELVGEQQIVVKTLPKYIKKIRGISGCTLLGNGDISLIIDTAGFFDK